MGPLRLKSAWLLPYDGDWTSNVNDLLFATYLASLNGERLSVDYVKACDLCKESSISLFALSLFLYRNSKIVILVNACVHVLILE